MGKLKQTINSEFENIIQLIIDARSRAFSKVNAELVLLYFNVGKVVSKNVSDGIWGDGTVDELADYIQNKIPGLSGFNRRGLYRMKQFYEVYSESQFVSPLVTQIETLILKSSSSKKVSAVRTQSNIKKKVKVKVSAVRTQLKYIKELHNQFVSKVLTQLNWTNHRLILIRQRP